MIEVTIVLIIFLFPLAYSPGPGKLFFCSQWCTLWFRRDCAFKHRLSYCNLACDSGDWAWYDHGFERLSECVLGIENIGCCVCFMARWETDPRRWIRWTGRGKASDLMGWDYIAYTKSESLHNHGIDVLFTQ